LFSLAFRKSMEAVPNNSTRFMETAPNNGANM